MLNTQCTKEQTKVMMHHAAAWNGVRLDHWRVLPGELPERAYSEHEISIPLDGNLTSLKQTATGISRVNRGNVGTVCIVPAGQPVAVHWREKIECVTLMLDPALVWRAASDADNFRPVELIETYDAEDGLIRHIGLALLEESSTKQPHGRLYAESLTNTLAMHLIRRYSAAQPKLRLFRGGLTTKKLSRAKEFINEHLEQDFSLADIAASAELSQYHFARAFKQTTGLTTQQYVTNRRIEQAKRLLAESELPLVEVAARSGFKNQSHFSTLFRKFTSVTPKSWRESKFS